jgi:hypothetical protein
MWFTHTCNAVIVPLREYGFEIGKWRKSDGAPTVLFLAFVSAAIPDNDAGYEEKRRV